MRRSSSSPDRGSALIEAVVIGSFVFIVVAAAVSAAIEVALAGGEAAGSARVAAVHSARHAGPDAALEMAGSGRGDVGAARRGDAIEVAVVTVVTVPHPSGLVSRVLVGRGEMPLAPFRSDRG